jgi:hypothetical protein
LLKQARVSRPKRFRGVAVTLICLLLGTSVVAQDSIPGTAIRTGEFDITSSLTQLLGGASAQAVADVVSPDDPITWTMYVPESYRPDRPAGLMVYVSPTKLGKIPQKWRSVLDKYNIIWVAANGAGNRTLVKYRATYALLAPTLANTHYNIDSERTYLSGFSGGGKVAGVLAEAYPSLFKGAIFICGIDALGKTPPSELEAFKQNYFVFLTGTNDQALGETRRGYRQYLKAGVENSMLMVIPNMGHQNPDRSNFAKAVRHLDSRFSIDDSSAQTAH